MEREVIILWWQIGFATECAFFDAYTYYCSFQPSEGGTQSVGEYFCRLFVESDYGPRLHWIKWDQLCKPYGEGGVRLRSLRHVLDAFSLKLWWKFRLGQSLWAEFMHLKYNANLHPCYSKACPGQSATWRRLLDGQVVAERYIRWVVGSGNSSFWHDNWLGSGRLCQQVEIFQEQPVADFVVQGCWDVQRLSKVLPTHYVQRVLEVAPPSSDQGDKMVLAPSTSREFSIASAY